MHFPTKGQTPLNDQVKLDKRNCIVAAYSHTEFLHTLSKEELRIDYIRERMREPQRPNNYLKESAFPFSAIPNKFFNRAIFGCFKYQCGMSPASLTKMLCDMAPKCAKCRNSKFHLCLEQCCKMNTLYCSRCEAGEHFLHQSNDFLAMFIEGNGISSGEQIIQRNLKNMMQTANLSIVSSQAIIERELRNIE